MKRNVLWRGSALLLLVALSLVGTLLGIAWRRAHPAGDTPKLTVTFLDVGDGYCALVRTPEGHVILIDTGSTQAAPAMIAALKQRNVSTIDLLVLLSPEETSIGGVPALLSSGVHVTQIWDNAVSNARGVRRSALEAIRRRHIPSSTASGGDTIQVGEMLFITALWPPGSGVAERRDPLVCRINYGCTAFIFEGAATAVAERDLIGQAGKPLECTGPCTDLVLQVATHAEGSPSPELLRRAAPAVAVISCGLENAPASAVLHRLQAAGAAIWRTDTQGTITFTANGRVSPVITADHL
jgi:competence protein ComEC